MRKPIGVMLLLALAQGWAYGQGTAKEFNAAPGQTTLTTPVVPAGVYQVTFRLRVDKLDSSVATLGVLHAGVPDYSSLLMRYVTPIHFTETNAVTDFVFALDNFREQTITARVQGPSKKLTVEGIVIAPCKGVAIGTVWPGKIAYRTGEDAEATVAVFNGAETPRTVTLKCALESDLTRVRPLSSTPLTLAPGERKEIPVSWNTGKEEYGFALAAELLDGAGKTVSTGREYFSVADNLWKVGITQVGRGCEPPSAPGPNRSVPVENIKRREAELAEILDKPLDKVYWSYCNYNEFYAWSPDDFFNMAPDVDYWYSGVGSYTMGKRHLQLAVAWLHRKGMRAISYLNPSTCGWGGEEAYRQHPEWFQHLPNGQPDIWAYDQKKLESGYTLSPEGPWKLQASAYALWLKVSIATLDPLNAQIAQILKSQKMFGWDGIRFDNYTYTAGGRDFWGKPIDPKQKDFLEVRAWSHMRESLWKQLGPGFVIGVNFDHQFRDAAPAAWDEACRKGGMLMEEVAGHQYQVGARNNRWQDFMVFYHNSGEAVRALGGHHLLIGFGEQGAVDQLYLNIFTYAGRSHPYRWQYHSETLPYGDYAQFMTRYSALMWDVDRVKKLPDADQRIDVRSAAPIWWKEYATVRTAPDGAKQYILHLVNPPVQERILSKTPSANEVPAPQENVTVTLTPDAGEKITRATRLTAEPTLTQQSLPVVANGNQVSVTIPKLRFWDVLVLE